MLYLQKQDARARKDARTLAIRMGLASLGMDPDEVIQCRGRGDALSISLAFARELEFVDKEFYEFEYPDLRIRDLVPLDTKVPAWAQTHSYRERDKLGEAAIVHDYGNDFPRVDIDLGENVPAPIVSLGCSYGYSVMDLRYAAELGVALETDKMNTAKEASERKLDQIGCYGHPDVGLRGFANNATIVTLSTGINAALTKDWANKTAAEVAAEIDMIINDVSNASENKHLIDTLAMPTTMLNMLHSKRFAALDQNGVELSVVDYFEGRKRNKVTFEPYFRLKAAGAGGTSRIVAYKKDPKVLKLVIPQDFESMPPERKNMLFQVACHLRFGGVDWRQPMAARYIDDAE